MKKHLIPIGLLSLASLLSLEVGAVPAKPGLRTVTTTDGTEITVRLAGDEFYHQYFTEDGYPLLERDGNFYYCDFTATGYVVDSGIKAGEAAARGTAAKAFLNKLDMVSLETRIVKRSEKAAQRLRTSPVLSDSRKAPARETTSGAPYPQGYGLFPASRGSQFPSYGKQKAIVVLVEYTDTKFNVSDPHDYFSRMLNEPGFSDYGGTGSAVDFFTYNSEGAFEPEFDVYGPITLSKAMSYYGGNDWYGNDQHPEQMVIEACQQLDDTVDFSEYDRDGDGYIDNVFVFYAGRGEASGGSADTVWPHAWNVTSATSTPYVFDGVQLDRYACSNEWESGRPDGVGTFVHEFSHVMGLPDLYATSYTSSFTPGAWSALDYGPYNNDGMTPPLYGAFERYALGWVAPREVTGPLSATLQPIGENVCGIIRTARDTEFFLLENRQKTSWDTYIPGNGMLIWHVDYNSSVWTSNKVNNTPSHQYVDIEEADGTQSEYTRSGDTFPGTSHKTSFTGDTNPAMKTWNNTKLDYPITDIAEADGLITFNVLGGSNSVIPAATIGEPTDIDAEGFTLNWTPVNGYDHYVSVWYYPETAGENAPAREEDNRVYLAGYKNYNAHDAVSLKVTGVEPDCDYYYTVTPSNGWESADAGDPKVVRTGRYSLDWYTAVATDATDVADDSFTANWLELSDADRYFLSVFEKIPGDPFESTCGFDGGVSGLPEGWSTNTGTTYSMASYCGAAAPSLRLGQTGAGVESGVYTDGISSLKFWHRGNATSADDRLSVSALTEEGWKVVASLPIVTEKGGETSKISELPDNAVKVKIEYIRAGGSGAVALDDVTLFHGQDYAGIPVEGYESLDVGNVLSATVTSLDYGTDYYYTICGGDGELVSRSSAPIFVTTSWPSGVVQVKDAATTVIVDGLTVTSDGMIEVFDYAGCTVAKGADSVTLPGAGLYVVRVASHNIAKKIIVK